jgi:hypothetical protein
MLALDWKAIDSPATAQVAIRSVREDVWGLLSPS